MEFEIIDAIKSNLVTVVCGETGSGKSTQVPQFLYEYGCSHGQSSGENDAHYLVGITQPRRVAAVLSAKRVVYEMGCGAGHAIAGHKIRWPIRHGMKRPVWVRRRTLDS